MIESVAVPASAFDKEQERPASDLVVSSTPAGERAFELTATEGEGGDEVFSLLVATALDLAFEEALGDILREAAGEFPGQLRLMESAGQGLFIAIAR